jgi:(p)ppGpp synthase/HD superfamily hydrolase
MNCNRSRERAAWLSRTRGTLVGADATWDETLSGVVLTMLDEPWYRETLAIARQLRADQVDKVGRPGAAHVERVARRLLTMFPDAAKNHVQAALLRDVLEDCDTTPVRLVLDGIEPEVVDLVERLTHQPETPYLDHVRAIAASGDVGAIRVTLADNMDRSAPDQGDFRERDRLVADQYLPARTILEGALAEVEMARVEWRKVAREDEA